MCTRYLMSSTVISPPNLSSKARDRSNDGRVICVLEIRVNAEFPSPPTPVEPKSIPLIGSCSHTSIGNCFIRNSEITRVIIFGLITNRCQQDPWGSWKCNAKRVRKSRLSGKFQRWFFLNERDEISAMLFTFPATCNVIMGAAWKTHWRSASVQTSLTTTANFRDIRVA